jgi:hypothetical protein
MLTDVPIPITDVALQLRIIRNPSDVVSIDVVESRGKSGE